MKKENKWYALVYIPLLDVAGGTILEFYNSVTMYLTHNIRKNKVNVDLEFLFLLHLNDGDQYSAKEDPYFLQFSEYC